jgi:hypothetical protein
MDCDDFLTLRGTLSSAECNSDSAGSNDANSNSSGDDESDESTHACECRIDDTASAADALKSLSHEIATAIHSDGTRCLVCGIRYSE